MTAANSHAHIGPITHTIARASIRVSYLSYSGQKRRGPPGYTRLHCYTWLLLLPPVPATTNKEPTHPTKAAQHQAAGGFQMQGHDPEGDSGCRQPKAPTHDSRRAWTKHDTAQIGKTKASRNSNYASDAFFVTAMHLCMSTWGPNATAHCYSSTVHNRQLHQDQHHHQHHPRTSPHATL